MGDVRQDIAGAIVTPDQRLRVFISSDPHDLADEHAAVVDAVTAIRLSPISFDAGARPYPARDIYRSYLSQSDVFVGLYGSRYGQKSPATGTSRLEDEFRLSAGMPRLVYVKDTAARDADLDALLEQIGSEGGLSYRRFRDAAELRDLLTEDIAVLLTERFTRPSATNDDVAADTQPSSRLPVTPTTLVGRAEDLDHVVRLVRDPQVRLVTLTGPGGVGKTRLALEAGAVLTGDFPDGQVILWLDGLKDPAFVLEAIGAELHVRQRADQTLLEAIGNHLRELRMLIVLDNFEHVIAAAPRLADLVAQPTGTTFMVTSRELLHVRGEHAVQLEPLAIPAAALPGHPAPPLQAVEQSEAVRLFVDRAQAISPGFRLTADNAADVAGIVTRLEGLPLALELAAARIRILPPGPLLQRLTTTLDLPAVGGRDLPARQHTLRDTIAWSYELLDQREQQAIAQLAVFAGGAELDAALQLLDLSEADALDVLESLLRKSLLRRSDGSEGPRLSMLAPIREFAGEQLALRGDDAMVRQRHAGYYLSFAATSAARIHSADQAQYLAGLDRELENLQASLEWLFAQASTDALVLANHLRWYWVLRGHLSAADSWMRRLLHMGDAPRDILGQAQLTAAMIALETGDAARAEELFASAFDLLLQAGDVDGAAWAQHGLGSVLYARGELSAARNLEEQALASFRGEEDLLGQCAANTRLGTLSMVEGDRTGAERRYQGSLAVRRQIGDPWGTSFVLTALSEVALLDDDFDTAVAYYAEGLELVQTIDHREGMARILDGLGTIAAARDRWDPAVDQFRRALRLYEAIGNVVGVGITLAFLSRAEIEIDAVADAREHALAAFRAAQRTGDARTMAAALDACGCFAAASGDPARAARLFGTAVGIRDRAGVPTSPLHPLGPGAILASLASALGDAMLQAELERGAILPAEELEAEILGATAT